MHFLNGLWLKLGTLLTSMMKEENNPYLQHSQQVGKVKTKTFRIEDIKLGWNYLNTEVFKGHLQEPIFRLTRSRLYQGKYVFHENSEAILFGVPAILEQEADIYEVLAHEMIHQWQRLNGFVENNHDETFTRWVATFKELANIDIDMEKVYD